MSCFGISHFTSVILFLIKRATFLRDFPFLFIAKACQLVNADGELHFQESFSKRTITALLHTKYTKIIKVKLKLYDGGPCLTKRKQDVTWEFWEDDVLKELEMLVTEPLSKKHSNAIGIYKVL